MSSGVTTLGFCARWLVRGLVWCYYAPIRITGRGHLPHGPILFVANHQDSLLDPVLIGLAARRRVRFLAKATLFDVPLFGSLLHALGMIPAYRPQDDAAQVRRNLEVLDHAAGALAAGETIGIFPEGKSHDLPRIEQVKSGAARIALKAAAGMRNCPVSIVPVGLNFERKEGFRTALWIQVGAPLDVAEFARANGGSEKETQRVMTEEIAARLRAVAIHLDDPNAAPLLDHLEHLIPVPGLRSPGPLARLQLRKRTADALNHFFAVDPARARAIEARIATYRDHLAAAGVEPGSPIMRFRRLRLTLRMLRDAFLLAAASVPALVGALFHLVPYAVTKFAAARMNRGRTTLALARLACALPLLAVWYAGAWFALRSRFLAWFAWAWMLAMPFLGMLALASWRKLKRGCRQWLAQIRLFFDTARLRALRGEQRDMRSVVTDLAEEFTRLKPRDPPLEPPVTWAGIAARAIRWTVVLIVAAFIWIGWSHWRRPPVEAIAGVGMQLAGIEPAVLAAMLDGDEGGLRGILEGIPALDARTRELAADFAAGRRNWFTQADNDALHETMRRYLALRTALIRMVWRYQNYGQISDAPLRARGFLCAAASASALTSMSFDFVHAFAGSAEAARKLDEAEPAWDIPAGLYTGIRRNLAARVNRQALEDAHAYYVANRATFPDIPLFHAAIAQGRAALLQTQADVTPGLLAEPLRNAAEEGRKAVYGIKTVVSTWMGDTKIREPGKPLIAASQLVEMRARLRPGDIFLERRNWFVSNAFLPGYWPHAALYVGTPAELRAIGLDSDPRVVPHWADFVRADQEGHPLVILESVSEGVVFTSLEHSIGGADSAALLRPRLAPGQIREAIARAFSHRGKPYDFEFDFFSADKLVCTELVYRAYDGSIRFPLKNIMGTVTLPAIEFVRKYAAERGTPAAQFDFILCIEGDEAAACARFVDEARFLKTLDLPGNDLLILPRSAR